MKKKVAFLVLLIAGMIVLAGCQKAETVQTEDANAAGAPALAGDRDWAERTLDGVNLLSLGTLNLEDTENAVAPEQAAKLLPLWQMIQGGALQSVAETDAVVKQIEGQMTEAQMAAIDAMGLTFDDYQVWMEAQGIEMSTAGEGQGAPGAMGDISEEDRAAMREQLQGLQDMTPEERTKAMAEMGIQAPEGGAGAGGFGGGRGMGGARGGNQALTPLIDLLTERAGQ